MVSPSSDSSLVLQSLGLDLDVTVTAALPDVVQIALAGRTRSDPLLS